MISRMMRYGVTLGGVCVFLLGLLSVGLPSDLSGLPPEIKMDRGIMYVSGGIGLDERETLRLVGQDYDLRLSFAEKAGNYLSDVEVVIKDAGGKTALETVSQGPWFFAKLPEGRYTILASTKGKTYQQMARVVPHGQTSLYFYW
jgi:hypothetical protein